MKIGALIYTRLCSKRLNNKGLFYFGKKKLVEHVIERVKKISNLDDIVLATSNSKIDNKLKQIAKNYKIKIFQGSEHDVLERTFKCLKKNKMQYFLRVCGDRIFFDNEYINNTLKQLKKSRVSYDLISNIIHSKVDAGLTVEVLSFKCVERLYYNNKLSSFNKEHITSYIYENHENFKIKELKSPKYHFDNYRYTIDNKKDVVFVKKIMSMIKKDDLYKFKNINKIYKKLIK